MLQAHSLNATNNKKRISICCKFLLTLLPMNVNDVIMVKKIEKNQSIFSRYYYITFFFL